MPRLPVFLAVLLSAFILHAKPQPSGDSLEIHFFAKVYAAPSERAPLLGITGDGTRLVVKERRPGWMAVPFAGVTGWIHVAPAAPVEADRPAHARRKPAPGPGLARHLLVAALPVLLFTAGLAVWILLRSRRRRNPGTEPVAAGVRAVFLLARHDTLVRSNVAELHIPMAKCFRELGFQVVFFADLRLLSAALKSGPPGILGVDCRMGPGTLGAMERIGLRHPDLKSSVIFFYNAERPEGLHPPASLPGAQYLGQSLSSQHLIEMVAPASRFEHAAGAGSKAPACVLEGRISRNSLAEILPFLEIGRRTGLLSIEDPHPSGLIAFEDGDITFAHTQALEGPDAVFGILALQSGTFRFFADRVTGRGNLRMSATQLILHWARKVDESGEVPAARP